MNKRPQSRLEKLAFLSNHIDLGRFEAPVAEEALHLALLTMRNARFRTTSDENLLRQYIKYYTRALKMLKAYSKVADEDIEKMLEAYTFKEE